MDDYSFLAIPFGITEGNPLLFNFQYSIFNIQYSIFNIQYPITNDEIKSKLQIRTTNTFYIKIDILLIPNSSITNPMMTSCRSSYSQSQIVNS